MTPSEEAPLRQEIKRLRDQLEYANERHTAAMDNIRSLLSDMEGKISATAPSVRKPLTAARPLLAEQSAQSAPAPPPLPVTPTEIESPAPLPLSPHRELDFGKVWFVRIGMVILLTGLVFLGNYAYQNWIREMPNGVRLAALFACALALVETGRRLAARDNLSRFGEVLLAGGMAFFYYCTFAAHHVDRLKIIELSLIHI